MAIEPGERRLKILQTLAEMLESPQGGKVTTALLASKLECSEAALYRHFASKAKMFDGLIDFIEHSLFGIINKITSEQPSGIKQVELMINVLLSFAQKNKGMTRVLVGDALVHENIRLQERINALIDKLESVLKQSLRIAATQGDLSEETDFGTVANLLRCHVMGRWLQYVHSGFRHEPLAQWEQQWPMLYFATVAR